MHLMNCGTLTLSVPVTGEILEMASEQIGSTIYRGVEANELSFEDVCGDIEDDLDELVKALREKGITVEGRIEYYGDYDGAYVIELGDEQCSNKSATEVGVMDAETETLIAELEKRGYRVLEPAPNGDKDGVCPVCGADIEYFDRQILDGNECECSWTCEKCGAEGSLAESIMFSQHYNIFDADGKRYLTGRTEGIDGEAAKKGGV